MDINNFKKIPEMIKELQQFIKYLKDNEKNIKNDTDKEFKTFFENFEKEMLKW